MHHESRTVCAFSIAVSPLPVAQSMAYNRCSLNILNDLFGLNEIVHWAILGMNWTYSSDRVCLKLKYGLLMKGNAV